MLKKYSKKRALTLAATLMAFSFLLSSCSFGNLFGDGSKAGIKKAVTAYLDEIKDGTFADNDYETDYASDAAFEDLEFKDDKAKDIMNISLEKMSYEIGDISGSVKNATGTCDVTLTVLDMDAIIDDLESGDGVTEDTLTDAVKSKKAPTTDAEITLDMEYDKDNKVWLVSDSEPLTDTFADAFVDLAFTGDPTAVIDSFMAALAANDTATIDSLSPYYDSTYFFDSESYTSSIQAEFYGKITYEIGENPDVGDTTATVDVHMVLPDLASIDYELSNDLDITAKMVKPYLLAEINGGDTAAAEEEVAQIFVDAVSERLNASNLPTIEADTIFSLELDSDSGTWVISDFPTELTDISFDESTPDDIYTEATLQALSELLNEGSIDQATYDEYYAYYSGETTNTSVGGDIASDIYFSGWYDYNTQDYVDSYDAAVTTAIEYEIDFNSDWSGTTFYYDWYNEGGVTWCYNYSETMESGSYAMYPGLTFGDNELIPADTYRLVVSLEDGTTVADVQVTVA